MVRRGRGMMVGEALVPAFAVRVVWLLCVLLISVACPALAVDNPDTPDLVAEFEARARKAEAGLDNLASTADIVRGYSEYEKFLDRELNSAYSALAKKVKGEATKTLAQSQRQWIQFRDREFGFIDSNWTLENFGTSHALSRGGYRSKIIHDRVVQLLYYLMNY